MTNPFVIYGFVGLYFAGFLAQTRSSARWSNGDMRTSVALGLIWPFVWTANALARVGHWIRPLLDPTEGVRRRKARELQGLIDDHDNVGDTLEGYRNLVQNEFKLDLEETAAQLWIDAHAILSKQTIEKYHAAWKYSLDRHDFASTSRFREMETSVRSAQEAMNEIVKNENRRKEHARAETAVADAEKTLERAEAARKNVAMQATMQDTEKMLLAGLISMQDYVDHLKKECARRDIDSRVERLNVEGF